MQSAATPVLSVRKARAAESRFQNLLACDKNDPGNETNNNEA
jgi:hypothetical protein